jgi:hypothetical protein
VRVLWLAWLRSLAVFLLATAALLGTSTGFRCRSFDKEGNPTAIR